MWILGFLFQSLGAKYEKVLPPLVDFAILGTTKSPEFCDLRERNGSLVRYAGAEPLIRNLQAFRVFTGLMSIRNVFKKYKKSYWSKILTGSVCSFYKSHVRIFEKLLYDQILDGFYSTLY